MAALRARRRGACDHSAGPRSAAGLGGDRARRGAVDPSGDPDPRGVSWHRAMVGRAADRADAIVVPSLAVADDLAGVFPRAADKLRVIGTA